jgi:alternate signal-mediated exported protein
MNKMIKGSVAGATGIVLLMGGFGTYALWSDSADMNGSKITSGVLDIKAGDVTWDGNGDWEQGDLVVPGDVVTRTQEFTVKGTGKNLKGDVTFTPGSEVDASELKVDVDVTSDNATVKEEAAEPNNFTFDAPFNTGTLTVVVTYSLPSESTGSENVTASIADSTLTIAQR